MLQANNSQKNFVSEAFGSLFSMTLLTGISLLMLGILIFAYPQLIGLLFAAFILVTGGAILYAAWRAWKFKREVTAVQEEWMSQPEFDEVKRHPYTFRRVTWIVR